MKINGKEVIGTQFAYDGCHKIYIIEDREDLENAKERDYKIKDIQELESIYNNSCSLKFISNWKLTTFYVAQGEKANFEKE